MEPVTTATLFLSAFVSPLLVAYIRDLRWSARHTALVAFAVVVVLHIIGQALDGQQTWPLPPSFWTILAAQFGAQQLVYQVVYYDRQVIHDLEQKEPPL